MKKAAFLDILGPIVADYRNRDYSFWLPHVASTEPIVSYPFAVDGTKCCVEINAFWDSKPAGDVRVTFDIDDGGLRALMPIGTDFIIASDGTFVGE